MGLRPLHGALHKLTFRFTKVVPGRLIEYRSLFPVSLIAPGNQFVFEPTPEGACNFTAAGHLRFPRWLFERMHARHKGKIEATQRHMIEEGENLKKAVEAKAG